MPRGNRRWWFGTVANVYPTHHSQVTVQSAGKYVPTHLWYSKNSSRLFLSCEYKTVAAYNHPEICILGHSFRAVWFHDIFGGFLSRPFTPSLWGSGEAKTLLVMKYRRCCHASLSWFGGIGFTYFGGRCGTKKNKKPQIRKISSHIWSDITLFELLILHVSLGDDCKVLIYQD